MAQWGPQLLLYTTQRGGVAAWDLRAKGELWALASPPSRGLVEHSVFDPLGGQHWLLTGERGKRLAPDELPLQVFCV